MTSVEGRINGKIKINMFCFHIFFNYWVLFQKSNATHWCSVLIIKNFICSGISYLIWAILLSAYSINLCNFVMSILDENLVSSKKVLLGQVENFHFRQGRTSVHWIIHSLERRGGHLLLILEIAIKH